MGLSQSGLSSEDVPPRASVGLLAGLLVYCAEIPRRSIPSLCVNCLGPSEGPRSDLDTKSYPIIEASLIIVATTYSSVRH